MSDLNFFKGLTIFYLQKSYFKYIDIDRKGKRLEKLCPANTN